MNIPTVDELVGLAPVERARILLAHHFPGGVGSWSGESLPAAAGEQLVLTSPADGEVFAEFRGADPESIESLLGRSASAGAKWAATDPFERARILRAVALALEAHVEELAVLECGTVGKPLRDCRAEAAKAAEMFGYYAGWADKLAGATVPVPGPWQVDSYREPYGLVAAITPWNAPLFTGGWNSAPGLACGNAVIVKPSEFTPLSTVRIAQIAQEAGLPPSTFSVLVGGGDAGRVLVEDRRVGMVGFIGSVATGRRVAASAGAVGKPVLLELGGKSANIVFDDADLDQAVYGALSAIFSAAGQSCVAGSRLLVHASIHDAFVERVSEGAARLRIGDPMDPETEIGPIIAPRHPATVRRVLAEATDAGATVRAGEGMQERPPALRGGQWLLPTVLRGVGPDHALERTEVFGPVLATDSFVDEDAVVERANGTGFGLAAAVWTQNPARARRVAARLRAGTVWVNAYKTIHVAAPFGGYGDSGFGRSSGVDALLAYTQAKAVWTPVAALPAPFPSLNEEAAS